MTEDDPRHGTTKGYHAECRCQPCRRAYALYEKRRRLAIVSTGRGLSVPAIGIKRRIEALMALGWTAGEIAAECGWTGRNDVLRLRHKRWLERPTADRVLAAYDRLSMTLPPPHIHRERNRNAAIRKGWLAPLMWDDDRIDDPDYRPDLGRSTRTYRADELAAEWEHLRSCGVSIHAAAKQLGVSVGAIEKALERRKEVA